MTEPTVRLHVSFDADQVSSSLVWHAVEGTPARNAFHAQGRHAGALHFEKGDQFAIDLTAFGNTATLKGLELLEAVLVTMPHTSVDRRSAPSPFATEQAVLRLAAWTKPESSPEPDPLRVRWTTRMVAPVSVLQETGRWELSLIVTVRLLRPEGQRSELRVFAFDPESEVGTGMDPP